MQTFSVGNSLLLNKMVTHKRLRTCEQLTFFALSEFVYVSKCFIEIKLQNHFTRAQSLMGNQRLYSYLGATACAVRFMEMFLPWQPLLLLLVSPPRF